jgi:hypothetical protein
MKFEPYNEFPLESVKVISIILLGDREGSMRIPHVWRVSGIVVVHVYWRIQAKLNEIIIIYFVPKS